MNGPMLPEITLMYNMDIGECAVAAIENLTNQKKE